MSKKQNSRIRTFSLCLVSIIVIQTALLADENKPTILNSTTIKITKNDDELTKLLKERYNSAVTELQAGYRQFQLGIDSFDTLFATSRRLLKSELELDSSLIKHIEIYKKHLEFAKHLEKYQSRRNEIGLINIKDVEVAKYWRLDTEIQLLRAKRKLAEQKKKL